MIGKSFYSLTNNCSHTALQIQKRFIANRNRYVSPPQSIESIRFYLVDIEDEDTETMVTAAISFFNQRNHNGEGGIWLQETFEDNGVTYATAAVWW